MDHNKEYHDPDYPEAAVRAKEKFPGLSEEEKIEKIKSIIRREFSNELEVRESEVMLIDQRMSTSRRLLHRLRYALVTRYYSDQKLHLSNGQIEDEIAAQRDPRARAELASQLRDGQRQIHPSVRKLLGKKTVDINEIFRTRGPRNKTRKDYCAMLQKRNYTISADSTKSLRPGGDEPAEAPGSSQPRKVPRHLDPKITNVLTLDEATRNKMKHRYRIIIGNTSKYVPAASLADRSTHKWLLYVRGAAPAPDLSRLVTAVTVTLHHSYAPHHVLHLDKPPFHVSRRGWGEFPATVELHFPLPLRNRPATVHHNIKLDRNYTGHQTLGSETVVDVWLYSTQDMLPYEFIETDAQTNKQTNEQTDSQPSEQPDVVPEIKTENNCESIDDNWMDFFTKAPTELDVDEMIIKPIKKEKPDQTIEEAPEPIPPQPILIEKIKQEYIEEEVEKPKIQECTNIVQAPNEIMNQPPPVKKRIVKYIDPTTKKIYYLEMDRELDLSQVHEIIINNKRTKISPIKSNGLKNVRKKKGGVSLLKPEIKNLLKSENKEKVKPNLSHIENDHCYLAAPKTKPVLYSPIFECVDTEVEIKREKSLYATLCSAMRRFTTVRAAVNYLVKKIPLISDEARDPDFMKNFPFVVESCEKYWKLDFAKRRNIEWSRAKLIQRLLSEQFQHTEPIWRTKQILLYIRMHGHYPVRNEFTPIKTENNGWSSWNDLDNVRELDSNIKETFPSAKDINTLTKFHFQLDRSADDTLEISDDEEIDVVGTDVRPEGRRERPEASGLQVLPVGTEDERLGFMYVERQCQDIGIELKNEDVGSGYSYSAVHAVLLSAMKSFAEELIRSALAAKRKRESPPGGPSVWTGSPSTRTTISLGELYSGAESRRVRVMTSRDTATPRKHTHAI